MTNGVGRRWTLGAVSALALLVTACGVPSAPSPVPTTTPPDAPQGTPLQRFQACVQNAQNQPSPALVQRAAEACGDRFQAESPPRDPRQEALAAFQQCITEAQQGPSPGEVQRRIEYCQTTFMPRVGNVGAGG